MADMARNYESSQEFWKPVTVEQREAVAHDVCESCGTDYPLGARFCYVCGADRSRAAGSDHSLARFVDIAIIRSALGLPVLSLIAFIVGITCVIVACVVGFAFTASTLLDWQAVQIWRMEWLLGAVAAFAVGILLKR
jgi:cytochrome c biogenesis protein CcdA